MLAAFTVVIVFSLVIMLHELGHFLLARRMGVKVERFSLGFGRVLWSVRKGETEYAISTIPFGGYVKMAGEEPSDRHGDRPWEFYAKPPGKRFWILLAGAGLNYLFAFLIFSFTVPTFWVGEVNENMPAYEAGIKPNDKIISIDGKRTRYWYEVLHIVSAGVEGEPLRLEIERDGEIFETSVTPVVLSLKDRFGKEIKTARIGVGFNGDMKILKAPPLQYLFTGAQQTFDNTVLTYRFLWRLITGKIPLRGNVAGPVGIAIIIGEATKIGFVFLLYLVGQINLALAIFNLLPFPVLDGGHILFLGLEKLRRRPLNPKTQEAIQYVAITLLVAFALFVSYNDIMLWLVKR